jgi:hypothetical protein
MSAVEILLLFNYTRRFEYVMALSVLILVGLFNIVFLFGYFTIPACLVITIITDVIIILPIIYLMIDNNRDRKREKTLLR